MAYAQFTKARWASGDLRGVPIVDAAKLIAEEWKALPEAQKKVWRSPRGTRLRPTMTNIFQGYVDEVAADMRRYKTEFQTVFGHEAGARPTTKTSAVAA